MVASMKKIGSTSYTSDWKFQSAISELWNSLRDAHTQYYPPKCYQTFLFEQGFGPISYVNSKGVQVVSVSPFYSASVVNYYRTKWNINIRDYAGAIIEKVDGINAMQYFTTFAKDKLGMAKDPGTRFHTAMTRPQPNPQNSGAALGYWQLRNALFGYLPETQNVTYTLLLPNNQRKVVSLPWVVTARANFTGLASFMKLYYATSDGDVVTTSKVEHNPDIQKAKVTVLKMSDTIAPLVASPDAINENINHVKDIKAARNYTLLASAPHLNFYELDDGKTMVITMDAFETGLNFIKYYKTVAKGFKIAAAKGLDKLIFDLTDNGGGSICLGRAMIAYVQRQQGTNWGPQDLPGSPLQQNLTLSAVKLNQNRTVWSPAMYDNTAGQHIANNDTSYMIPGIPRVRGGKFRNYSKPIHIDHCGEIGYQYLEPVDYEASDVIILTHGFCGSTCSIFSTHLHSYDNVRAVVVGGIHGQPQQFVSFPGGQVMDDTPLFQTLESLGQDVSRKDFKAGEIQPRQLFTSAAFRMCVRELYPKSSFKAPLEFTFQQADNHLDDTLQSALAPETLWYTVAEQFFN